MDGHTQNVSCSWGRQFFEPGKHKIHRSVSTVNNGQVKEIASGMMMVVMLEVMERRRRGRSEVILRMMLLKRMMMMMRRMMMGMRQRC